MVGFVKEAQSKVAALNLPRSVEIVWGGQFENFNRAKADNRWEIGDPLRVSWHPEHSLVLR